MLTANLQLKSTSCSFHSFTQFFSPFIPFYLPHERHTLNAILFAASRGIAKVAITTPGSTARAYNLYTITVRAGKSVMLLSLPLDIDHDAIAARVMQGYSSQNATALKSVVAEAWRECMPMPSPDVAGQTISLPSLATHL